MASNISKNWYVVNTYSSHENKVKDNLEKRIESHNLQDYIFRIIVAEHEVPVMKNGQPTGKTKMKNLYPTSSIKTKISTFCHALGATKCV